MTLVELEKALLEVKARGDEAEALLLFNERLKLLRAQPPLMPEKQVTELVDLLNEANAHAKQQAPYVRARDRIAAVDLLPNNAAASAKARALGEALVAIADALEDTTPELAPQRGRLAEYVHVIGMALAALKKRRKALETEHVVDLLEEGRRNHADGRDGWCSVEECLMSAVKWLASRGYERAAEHLQRERTLVADVLRASDTKSFNKALVTLLNAGSFAPITPGSLRTALTRARKARPRKRAKSVTAAD